MEGKKAGSAQAVYPRVPITPQGGKAGDYGGKKAGIAQAVYPNRAGKAGTQKAVYPDRVYPAGKAGSSQAVYPAGKAGSSQAVYPGGKKSSTQVVYPDRTIVSSTHTNGGSTTVVYASKKSGKRR